MIFYLTAARFSRATPWPDLILGFLEVRAEGGCEPAEERAAQTFGKAHPRKGSHRERAHFPGVKAHEPMHLITVAENARPSHCPRPSRPAERSQPSTHRWSSN